MNRAINISQFHRLRLVSYCDRGLSVRYVPKKCFILDLSKMLTKTGNALLQRC